MIELADFVLEVWCRDCRFKDGERLLQTYRYTRTHQQWMEEEVRDLQSGLYPKGQFRLRFRKSWARAVDKSRNSSYNSSTL